MKGQIKCVVLMFFFAFFVGCGGSGDGGSYETEDIIPNTRDITGTIVSPDLEI